MTRRGPAAHGGPVRTTAGGRGARRHHLSRDWCGKQGRWRLKRGCRCRAGRAGPLGTTPAAGPPIRCGGGTSWTSAWMAAKPTWPATRTRWTNTWNASSLPRMTNASNTVSTLLLLVKLAHGARPPPPPPPGRPTPPHQHAHKRRCFLNAVPALGPVRHVGHPTPPLASECHRPAAPRRTAAFATIAYLCAPTVPPPPAARDRLDDATCRLVV